MIKLLQSLAAFADVLRLALGRGILPSALSSADGREVFLEAAREWKVFSARTTRATYLQGLRDRLERLMTGGYDNGLPKLRLELKQLLAELAYDPATGFPGDAALEIPPAEPGSLRDLSSDRRLNLILKTQEGLLRNAAKKVRGLDRVEQFPAWELVRVQSRRVPRGELGTKSWERRWFEAGGPAPVFAPGVAKPRLIALKTDPIWAALGDASRFDDALGVDHPPFAFNSGMGWNEISYREWDRLSADGQVSDEVPVPVPQEPTASLPKAELPAGLSLELLRKLRAKASPAYREQLERRLAAA